MCNAVYRYIFWSCLLQLLICEFWWIQHVNRMPRNRLSRVMKHYSPTGRRNHGRPLKRLLDTWDWNGSTSGPTAWQIYDYDDDEFMKIAVGQIVHLHVCCPVGEHFESITYVQASNYMFIITLRNWCISGVFYPSLKGGNLLHIWPPLQPDFKYVKQRMKASEWIRKED
jgi:hypothetical protein